MTHGAEKIEFEERCCDHIRQEEKMIKMMSIKSNCCDFNDVNAKECKFMYRILFSLASPRRLTQMPQGFWPGA